MYDHELTSSKIRAKVTPNYIISRIHPKWERIQLCRGRSRRLQLCGTSKHWHIKDESRYGIKRWTRDGLRMESGVCNDGTS